MIQNRTSARKTKDPKPADLPTPGEVFSAELVRVRKRKEWTQQQLADRLKQLGHPMGRVVIQKIEANRRKVTIDELIALAAALEVSPLFLLLPRDAESQDPIRVAGRSLQVEMLTSWWHGAQELDFDDPGIEHDERIFDESRPGLHVRVAKRFPEIELIWRWSIWTLAGLSGGSDYGFRVEEEAAAFATLMERQLERLKERRQDDPIYQHQADFVRELLSANPIVGSGGAEQEEGSAPTRQRAGKKEGKR